MNKKIIFGIVVLIALVVGGFVAWEDRPQDEKLQATQFTGSIDKVEGNTVYMTGDYMVKGVSVSKLSLSEQAAIRNQSVQVRVNKETEIVLTLYTRPSIEQLKINPGPYDMDELSHTEKRVQLTDFSDGQPIVITAQNNIYGKKKFTALRIDATDMTW